LPPLTVKSAAPIDATRWLVLCISAAIPQVDICAVDLSLPALAGVHVVRTLMSGAFDEARPIEVHVPERCRLLPLDEMYLGRIAM